jgi:hypothetical protein
MWKTGEERRLRSEKLKLFRKNIPVPSELCSLFMEYDTQKPPIVYLRNCLSEFSVNLPERHEDLSSLSAGSTDSFKPKRPPRSGMEIIKLRRTLEVSAVVAR